MKTRYIFLGLKARWLQQKTLFIMFFAIVCMLPDVAYAQTPMYVSPTGAGANIYPLGTTSGQNRVQWLYEYSEFTPALPATTVSISKIYIKTTGGGASTYTNFRVQMGMTALTATGGGNWFPVTQVYQGNLTIPAQVSGDYIEVTLQTPYNWDTTQNLIVDVSHQGYTVSRSVMQNSVTPLKRQWGDGTGANPTGQGTGLVELGIDIRPTDPCTGTPNAGSASATETTACTAFDLVLTGHTWAANISYQWQRSPQGAGAFTDIPGADTERYTVLDHMGASDYRCIVTCENTNMSDTTNVVSVGHSGAITGSFSEHFDTTAVGNSGLVTYPDCWYYMNDLGVDAFGYVADSNAQSPDNSYRLFRANTVGNSGKTTALISPETDNLGNGTKQVRFSVRAADNAVYQANILEVVTSDTRSGSSNFTVLSRIPVTHTDYFEYEIPFPVTTDDFFGFRLAYNNSTLPIDVYIDDVFYEDIPTCVRLNPSNINITGVFNKSATITWTDPVNVNAAYEVEVREMGDPGTPGAAFIGLTQPGVMTITATGLTPSSEYTVYVRAVCSPTDSSRWAYGGSFTTECDHPELISAPPHTICGDQPVDLIGYFTKGTVHWYDSQTSETPIHSGSDFRTPILTSSRSYWVTAVDSLVRLSEYAGKRDIGLPGTASGTVGAMASYMSFTAHEDFILESVDVFPNGTGTGVIGIELRTDTGVPIDYRLVNVTGYNTANAEPQTVMLNFDIEGGKGYRLGINTWAGGVTNLWSNDLGVGNSYYPVSDSKNAMTITGNNLNNRYWYFFYNWKIQNDYCAYPERIEIPVTITPGAPFELDKYVVTSCGGGPSEAVHVSVNDGSYNTYTWNPSTGVSGDHINGWTFSTAHEQEYVLIAGQTNGICRQFRTVKVYSGVDPVPETGIPDTLDICVRDVYEMRLFNDFPVSSAGIGTSLTASAAYDDVSAFVNEERYSRQQFIYGASELIALGVASRCYITELSFNILNTGAVASNDNYEIKMMMSPNTTFVSDAFYTGSFTTVYSRPVHTHSFQGWQNIVLDRPFYWDGQSNIVIEITQEGIGSSSPANNNAQTYYTETTGNDTGLFAHSAESDPVSGTRTEKRLDVRFAFEQPAVRWSPASGLYTDAGGTIPYVSGQNAPVVYTVSSTAGSSVYTALIESPQGCVLSKDFTVNTVDVGTPSVQTQTFCSTVPVSNIVVTGHNGAPLHFYSSLTSTVPITAVTQSGTYYVESEQGDCKSLRIAFNITITDLNRPSVQTTQTICGSGTVSDLVASGTGGARIIWYSSPASSTPLSPSDVLTNNTEYYAAQELNGCESDRSSVMVYVNPIPPGLSPQPSVSICGGMSYGNVNLNQAPGVELVWYQSAASQQPIPNTSQVSNGTYYVAQKINGCESPRVPVTLSVQAGNVPVPVVTPIQTICGGGTVAQLAGQTVSGGTLVWYGSAASTVPLQPSDVLQTGTYYAAQQIGNCLSDKRPVSVRITSISAPAVNPFNLCEGAVVADLHLPQPTGTVYRWYINGTSAAALNPSDVLTSGFYFVEKEQDGCISDRTQVQVVISPRPNSPTGSQNQSFDNYAEINDIVMNEPNIVWYLTYNDAVNNINPLPHNMPLVDGETYYAVIIGANNCPSEPAAVKITITLGAGNFDLAQLRYFPNPADAEFNISYVEPIRKVELFTLTGQLVLTREFDSREVKLDLSRLSTGTYMARVKTETASQFIKVVRK